MTIDNSTDVQRCINSMDVLSAEDVDVMQTARRASGGDSVPVLDVMA